MGSIFRGLFGTHLEMFGAHLGPLFIRDPFGVPFYLFGIRLVPFGDPFFIWGHLGPIWGAFWGTFLEACLNLYVKRDMHEHISIYHGLAMSELLEN